MKTKRKNAVSDFKFEPNLPMNLDNSEFRKFTDFLETVISPKDMLTDIVKANNAERKLLEVILQKNSSVTNNYIATPVKYLQDLSNIWDVYASFDSLVVKKHTEIINDSTSGQLSNIYKTFINVGLTRRYLSIIVKDVINGQLLGCDSKDIEELITPTNDSYFIQLNNDAARYGKESKQIRKKYYRDNPLLECLFKKAFKNEPVNNAVIVDTSEKKERLKVAKKRLSQKYGDKVQIIDYLLDSDNIMEYFWRYAFGIGEYFIQKTVESRTKIPIEDISATVDLLSKQNLSPFNLLRIDVNNDLETTFRKMYNKHNKVLELASKISSL
jgi:hypothetical protein